MHIFLTGRKRVGKSTLVRNILEVFPGTVGGFRTVKLDTFLPGQPTVHLFSPGESLLPTWDNFLFHCGTDTEDTLERFGSLGGQALKQTADLLLMDELGPHEGKAAAFQQAVWAAIEGDTPILGVLQRADTPFLKEIAAHPKVMLLEVTEENRDSLSQHIPEFLNILKER